MPQTIAPAPWFRRFGAFVHEGFFLVAFVFIVELLITRLAGGEIKGLWRNISQAALFCALGVYFVWQWTAGRRTLAQKTWALRLVSATTHTQPPKPLEWSQALKRYVASWIGPALALGAYSVIGKTGLVFLIVNFAWAVVDRERQYLHDRIAGTKIVFVPERP